MLSYQRDQVNPSEFKFSKKSIFHFKNLKDGLVKQKVYPMQRLIIWEMKSLKHPILKSFTSHAEFEYYLRKKNLKAKLKEHESAVNYLCHVRLEIARYNTIPDYQVEEVQNALKELKLRKSVSPTGLIREVCIRGDPA